MKKIVLSSAFLLSIYSMQAQEFFSTQRVPDTETSFTRKVNDISYDIDVIIKTNKDKLKEALNKIEKQVENNELTKEEADKIRNEKAEFYAQKIEEETTLQEDRIKKLINNKIEDNINFSSDMSAYQKKLIEKKVLFIVDYNFGSSLMFVDGKSNQDIYNTKSVFSSFGVGLGAKTRIGKETSRMFWKSTIDVIGHTFKFNDNKTFENINNETVLVDIGFPVKKSTMYMYEIKLSNYLEYDFSKRRYDESGNPIIKSRQSFYIGAGGFIGLNSISRNLVYEQNGEKYREQTGAKFNSNKFTYGIGAYIGHQNFTIRYTYNINRVFKRSFANQNVFNMNLVYELL